LATTAVARAVYVDVLGLSPLGEVPNDGITFAPGNGTKVAVCMGSQHEFRPVAAWEVDDVAAEVAVLRERGVVLEDYPGKSVNGIIYSLDKLFQAAFFRDTEGNLLGITRHPS